MYPFLPPNYDESGTEGARQGQLQRSLCDPITGLERESGIDAARGRSGTRSEPQYRLRLGKRDECPARFDVPGGVQTLRIEANTTTLTERINFFRISEMWLLTAYFRNAKIPSVTFAVRQDNNQDTPYSRFSLPRTSQFGSGRRFFFTP